jgi:bifunctional non-homologous end joining protein LigD
VIDLDPVDLPFARVIETAIAVRKVLERGEVDSVCKTSGKRGLHIYVPLGGRATNDEARQFAELIGQLVHAEFPATTSLVRNPRDRKRKVYLDYLQNRRGQTMVAPYSVRPQPGATVSTPLKWSEVRKGLDPTRFTMKSMARRVDRVGDLWQPILGPGIDLAASLKKLAASLE